MWKDSETDLDFLDFNYLTKTIVEIINNDDLTPSSIGIYGNWGSGKSSLMNMCSSQLSQDPKTLCIKFNGWLFEGYEDSKTALLGTILDTICDEKTLTAKAKDTLKRLYTNTDKLKLASMGIKYGIDFFATGGIGTIADLTMNSITSKLKDKAKDISETDVSDIVSKGLNSQELREDIRTFQTDFVELLLKTKIDKLVIFIDELDRCNPNTILETLEAIRLFLFTPKTSFVIGADERHVIYSVRTKYSEIEGNHIDIGKEYLEKMIQYPIRIPQLSGRDVEFYILCLLLKDELKDNEFDEVLEFIKNAKEDNFFEFELTYNNLQKALPEIAGRSKESISLAKQLSSVLSTGLNGNPRHCKRFLNSLYLRLRMSKHRNIDLNKRILAKLMMLEYFKSNLFKKLSEIQTLEKGKPEDLKYIESDTWEKASELALWKDDEWVKSWFLLEPKLSNTDLRPYFYFSRESLSNQLNLAQYRLSEIGQECLKNLLSGADSQRRTALKNAASISEAESDFIFKKLSDELLSQEMIDTKVFHSLLEWGVTSESLYTGVIVFLSEVRGKQLKIPVIPRVKSFMNKTNKVKEIYEILDSWILDNSKLKAAVHQNFKELK